MKTTFKKTMAVLSAAAVVAASAVSMATSVSAASTLAIESKTVTMSELAASNNQVTLSISADEAFTKATFGFTIPSDLEYVSAKASVGMGAISHVGDFVWFPVISVGAIDAGTIGSVTVTLVDPEPGKTYTLEATNVGHDADSSPAEFTYEDGTNVQPTVVNGTITVVADATEAPTTEAPTAAPTDAPTDAPAVTTTVAVASGDTTVTTTAAKSSGSKSTATSTSSPQTGDALPVAGVAVAVAVIGGVALVSKKRK